MTELINSYTNSCEFVKRSITDPRNDLVQNGNALITDDAESDKGNKLLAPEHGEFKKSVIHLVCYSRRM